MPDPRDALPALSPLASSYLRRAANIAVTMGQYAARLETRGLGRGARALGALGRDVAARIAPGDRAVECPICGWSGPRFGPAYYFDQFRQNVHCYRCGSTDRCRLVKLYVDAHLGAFFGEARRRVLDIGPVAYSRGFFPRDVDYVSFDLFAPSAIVHGDLCAAPFADAYCDLWLCFHVLDLVPDDGAAMRELFRILRPGGVGLLDHVMNWEGPTEEFEGPRARDAGHRRRYGYDLPDRLRAIGFEVDIVDSIETLDEATRARHGIHARRFLRCRRP